MKLPSFFLVIILILTIQSCTKYYDTDKYGKVSMYKSSSNSTAFLFKVEEGFAAKSFNSKRDKEHPLMNKAQVDLLNQILVDKKLCLGQYNYPKFRITSKQERIYDVTFANLIEQNYNTKPIVPLTYFGKCV
jgi:hypothetical protein